MPNSGYAYDRKNEIHYTLHREDTLTEEEIAMIEAANAMPVEYDGDNPEIDPVKTPELYAALIKAVAERNQRIAGGLRSEKVS